MDIQTDRHTDSWTDDFSDGQTEGWADGRMDRQTDRQKVKQKNGFEFALKRSGGKTENCFSRVLVENGKMMKDDESDD